MKTKTKLRALRQLLILSLILSVIKVHAQEWSEDQILPQHPDIGTSDAYGHSVSISGNFAIVGSPGEYLDADGNNPLTRAGAAYVYERFGGSWNLVQKITASDRASLDFFGSSVAINNVWLVVGAPNHADYSGAAYVFERQMDGTWIETQKLVPDDPGFLELYGSSVDVSFRDLIVGAPSDRDGQDGDVILEDSGAAYTYKRLDDGNWELRGKLTAADRYMGDRLGEAVAIYHDFAVVGAPDEDEDESGNNTMDGAGSAYIFQQNEQGEWNQSQKIVPEDRNGDESFGASVSMTLYSMVVGCPNENDGEGSDEGAAYTWQRQQFQTNWTSLGKIIAQRLDNDGNIDDRRWRSDFGASVSTNGSMVMVGAPRESYNEFGVDSLLYAGAAYFYAPGQKVVPLDRDTVDVFGWSVATSGYFSIIGAPTVGDPLSPPEIGKAYIFQNEDLYEGLNCDNDADSDGVADCNDLCPGDANKIIPGPCGCGDEDLDGDGVCASVDCDDTDADKYLGALCDDGFDCTENDVIDEGCECQGTPDDSLANNDLYCDGIETCDVNQGVVFGTPPNIDDGIPCTADSCNEVLDIIVNIPDPTYCEDEDPCTINICDPISGCLISNDSDGDGVCDEEDCAPNDPELYPGVSCDDGDPCTDGDVIDSECNCAGTPNVDDSDGDGYVDCLDGCPDDVNKIEPGDCGCGQEDLDENGDSNCPCHYKAYVTNSGSHDMTTVNLNTEDTGLISVGADSAPVGVAVCPQSNKVFISNANGNSMSIIDMSADTILSEVALPTAAANWGIASTSSGDKVVIAANDVHIYETLPDTLHLVNIIGSASGVVISPDNSKAYVTINSGTQIAVIDLLTVPYSATYLSNNAGSNPNGVDISADGQFLYVSNYGSANMSIFDLAADSDTLIDLGPYPGGVAVSPDHSEVAVSISGDDIVCIYNVATGDTTNIHVPVGTWPNGASYTNDGSILAVSLQTGSELLWFETDSYTLMGSAPIGSNSHSIGKFLVTTCGGCMDVMACNYDPNVNEDDGSCIYPGASCDDGDVCTTNDQFDANCNCVGTVLDCDDGNECTTDSCDPILGECLYENVVDGTECDDGDPTTISACLSGECVVVDYDMDLDGFNASEDCDDTNSDTYPGAPELCDGLDNDCDGEVDEGLGIDTDQDGLTDCEENTIYFTNPLMQDTDLDGLTDGLEVYQSGTDPNLSDTDGDDCTDDLEFSNSCDTPCPSDLNGDGFVDTIDLLEVLSDYNSACPE